MDRRDFLQRVGCIAGGWAAVPEWQPRNGIHGDLLLARIRWNRPNRWVRDPTSPETGTEPLP